MRDISEGARELQEVYADPSPYPMVHPFSLCNNSILPPAPIDFSSLAFTVLWLSLCTFPKSRLRGPSPPDTWPSCRMSSPDIVFTLAFFYSPSTFSCYLDLSSWFNSYLYWCHYLKQNKTTSKTHLTWKYRYKVKFEEVSRSIFFKQNLYLWFSFKSELC